MIHKSYSPALWDLPITKLAKFMVIHLLNMIGINPIMFILITIFIAKISFALDKTEHLFYDRNDHNYTHPKER